MTHFPHIQVRLSSSKTVSDQPQCSINSPFVCLEYPFINKNNFLIPPIICKNKPSIWKHGFYSGFSLIELLLTVAMLGVLAGLAVPSMNQFLESNRLSSWTNDLIADINLARVEAIKSNARTGLCAASGSTCATTTNWGSSGWLVMMDSDNNGSLDAVIKRHDPAVSNTTVTAAANALNFDKQGRVGNAAWGNITICNARIKKSRQVNVGATGRVQLTEGTC